MITWDEPSLIGLSGLADDSVDQRLRDGEQACEHRHRTCADRLYPSIEATREDQVNEEQTKPGSTLIGRLALTNPAAAKSRPA
jgi:hypothetical protein